VCYGQGRAHAVDLCQAGQAREPAARRGSHGPLPRRARDVRRVPSPLELHLARHPARVQHDQHLALGRAVLSQPGPARVAPAQIALRLDCL